MKQLRKLLPVIITVVLFLCLSAGVFARGEGESKTEAERPTISWWAIEWGYVTYTSDLKVVEALEDAGGVEIEMVGIPGDVYREKFNTQLAARDLPDVMFTGNRNHPTASCIIFRQLTMSFLQSL